MRKFIAFSSHFKNWRDDKKKREARKTTFSKFKIAAGKSFLEATNLYQKEFILASELGKIEGLKAAPDKTNALKNLAGGQGSDELAIALYFLTIVEPAYEVQGKKIEAVLLPTKRKFEDIFGGHSKEYFQSDWENDPSRGEGGQDDESFWEPWLELPEQVEQTGLQDVIGRLNYRSEATRVYGRDTAKEALSGFASDDPGFKWVQISGVAGQGKSRMALWLARKMTGQGWHAGFLARDELEEFVDQTPAWAPTRPQLIIIDYVFGHEENIGLLLRALAQNDGLQKAVRVILLERQRWDRGGVEKKSIGKDGEIEFELGSGRADWFETLCAAARSSNKKQHLRRGQTADLLRHAAQVIDLPNLTENDLVRIVRDFARTKIQNDDRSLKTQLGKIDPKGRPLFAMLLAEALSDTAQASGKEWDRAGLLDYSVTRNYHHRWPKYFDGVVPELGDDNVAMCGALLATLVRGIERRSLVSHFSSQWTSTTHRQAMVLLDAPFGHGAAGPGRYLPPLEPDLLGGWMLLRSMKNGLNVEELVRYAWHLSPTETGATMRRIGEDFPGDPDALSLFDIEPETDEGKSACASAATAAFRAAWTKEFQFSRRQLDLLKKASEEGDGEASGLLGLVYTYGNGLHKDDVKALEFFELGAKQGSESARDNWGLSLMQGKRITVDLTEVKRLFEQGVRCDRDRSRCLLASVLQRETECPESLMRSIKLLTAAAENQYPPAMFSLAFNLEKGTGFDAPDPREAMIWYRKAAEAGNEQAMFNLAVNLQQGTGLDAPDPREAMIWYRQAAEAGNDKAMFNLAVNLEKGTGFDAPDPREAMIWYRQAAEAGHDKAMFNLAVNLEQGTGLDAPDPREAMIWYRQAAEAGIEQAASTLKACAFAVGEIQSLPESDLPHMVIQKKKNARVDTPEIGLIWTHLNSNAIMAMQNRLAHAIANEGLSEYIAGQTLIALRQAPLPFYPGLFLVDFYMSSSEGVGGVDCFSALVSNNSALLLNGTSQRLHVLNATHIALDSVDQRDAYLRFFCEYVRYEGKPFHILVSADEIDWLEPVDNDTLEELRRVVRPPREVSTDASSGQYMWEAEMLYGDTVYTAQFIVHADGKIEMQDDTLISAQMPVQCLEYREFFRICNR